jgi:hypothetical protein
LTPIGVKLRANAISKGETGRQWFTDPSSGFGMENALLSQHIIKKGNTSQNRVMEFELMKKDPEFLVEPELVPRTEINALIKEHAERVEANYVKISKRKPSSELPSMRELFRGAPGRVRI